MRELNLSDKPDPGHQSTRSKLQKVLNMKEDFLDCQQHQLNYTSLAGAAAQASAATGTAPFPSITEPPPYGEDTHGKMKKSQRLRQNYLVSCLCKYSNAGIRTISKV